MKFVYGLIFTVACVGITAASILECKHDPVDVPTTWRDMDKECRKAMRDQVQMEIEAAMTYLAMGAHFARDSQNRPGFSKVFFESASEEREHALKIIEYLLMRGELTEDVTKLLKLPIRLEADYWASGAEALKAALELEIKVTASIRKIIRTCESPPLNENRNDYHLVDYLTADFLDEQLKGQREIAGRLSTLSKMMASHGPLGEFLFDKKLLKNEL